MSKSTKGFQPPTHQEIAARAHGIYEKEGRPQGKASQHWLQAEAQLVAERKAQAEQPQATQQKTPGAPRGDGWTAAPRTGQPVHRN